MIRKCIQRGTIIVCFLGCIGAFGQTFAIQSRSTPGGDILRLDQTLTVTYNVTSSGSERVIPVLRPSDPGLADSISVTWQDTTATNSLSALTFKIHLYNDTELCSNTIPFELLFYSEEFNGAQTASGSSGDLEFDTTGGDQVSLTHLIVETQPLPWPLSNSSSSTHFFIPYNVAPDVIANPNNRIFFWVDYYLAGRTWTEQFDFFNIDLDSSGCKLSAPAYLDGFPQVSGEVVDATGPTTIPVTLAPLGGASNNSPLGLGINVLDVTDLQISVPACGNTLRESLDFSSGGQIVWRYSGFGMVVRRFAFYVGTIGACDAQSTIFGSPPSPTTFQVEDFFLSSLGDVNATLTVPSAWRSGNQLNSDLRVQWFLRTDGYMASVGGESRELDLVGSVARSIDTPADYFLEARIRRTTGEEVSTNSRGYNHNLNYTVEPHTFQRAEQEAITGTTADEYLDPGEIVHLPVQVTENDGATLTNLTADHGLVIDDNGNGVIDGDDIFLTNDEMNPEGTNLRFQALQQTGTGSSRTLTLPFELLTTTGMPTIWFYVDVDYDANGITSTYRRYTSALQLNREVSSRPFAYDFAVGAGSDWIVNNDASTANSGAWAYDDDLSKWVGNGGTDVDNSDDLYRFSSPIFPLGTTSHVEFRHFPDFTFNQSAGMLEYRTRLAMSTWNPWVNLISTFCPDCDYLNDSPFPTTPDSYFSGRQVWMSDDGAGLPRFVNVDIPTIPGRDEIQFRFVFGDPSLVDTDRSSGDTHWEVDCFTYQSIGLGADNIFGVDLTQPTQNVCDDPGFQFEAFAPIDVEQLTFEWYESLSDLYNDVSNGEIDGAAGALVPFTPTVDGTYTYYARIKYLGTERIMPLEVIKDDTCIIAQCLTQDDAIALIKTDVAANWPAVSVNAGVTLVNLICP